MDEQAEFLLTEVVVATSNRNFLGRIEQKARLRYSLRLQLAAASAIAGKELWRPKTDAQTLHNF